MVGIWDVLLGGVFALIGVWALHRLSVVANAALTLRGVATNDTTRFINGQTIAINGPVFVDEPASIVERLFDADAETIGAYIWHAWFPEGGQYTYNSDRGELQQTKNTFASGLESGRAGVTVGGQPFYTDFSWLKNLYDSDTFSQLEVGDPASNTRLPTVLTRHLWDSLYVSLESTVGGCSMSRLTDIVDLYREEVVTDHFNIESRGIRAGQQLFVCGELRVTDGEYTVVGTSETPLLVSDNGRKGLIRQLRWRAVKYVLALLGATGLGAFFVL